jgi:hypothetical protein
MFADRTAASGLPASAIESYDAVALANGYRRVVYLLVGP